MEASTCQEQCQECFHLFMTSAHPAELIVCWLMEHAYTLYI